MALFWFGLRQNWRRFWQPFCPRFYMACTVVYHTLCPHQNVFKIVCLGNTQIIKWDAPKMFGFNPSQQNVQLGAVLPPSHRRIVHFPPWFSLKPRIMMFSSQDRTKCLPPKLILDKIETLNFIIETFQIPSETCILKPGTGGGVGFGMPLCMAHRILDKMAAKIGARSGANQTNPAPEF